jgi:surface polysaccharide O-acyltransferase-like enzyme
MRNVWVDTFRGCAVSLMIFDHLIVVFTDFQDVRNFTRIALPMFCVLSGYLSGDRLGDRYGQLWLSALLSWPIVLVLELALIHILLVFALVYPLLFLPPTYFLFVLSLGLLQAFTWPIGWAGYEPGYVFAFLSVGRLMRLSGWQLPSAKFSVPVVSWLGRWPLSAYVSHIFLIYFVSTLMVIL